MLLVSGLIALVFSRFFGCLRMIAPKAVAQGCGSRLWLKAVAQGCGIGSSGVPRPSLGDYVAATGLGTRRSTPKGARIVLELPTLWTSSIRRAGAWRPRGSPIRLSAWSTEVTRAPLLGEHNAEILGKVCGLGAEELAKLKADGVI